MIGPQRAKYGLVPAIGINLYALSLGGYPPLFAGAQACLCTGVFVALWEPYR